jgi:hypothetical protein
VNIKDEKLKAFIKRWAKHKSGELEKLHKRLLRPLLVANRKH